MSNNKINIELDLEAKPTPRVIRIIRGIANVLDEEATGFTPAGSGTQPTPPRKRKTTKKEVKDEGKTVPPTRKDAIAADDDKIEADKKQEEQLTKAEAAAAKKQQDKIIKNMKSGKTVAELNGELNPDPNTEVTDAEPTESTEAQAINDTEVVDAEEVTVQEEPKPISKPSTEKQYTIEEVRVLMRAKARKHKNEIKANFINFGDANGLTSMDKEHYPAFMEFLQSLDD